MACFNPARDLGPRIFSALAGWGSVPFTVNGIGWLTVYCIAPVLGGLAGGVIYQGFLARAFAHETQDKIDQL
jgi:glycerol uptake facilitator protein